MSFSSDIKNELCRLKTRPGTQQLAVLSGLTQTCSTLRLSKSPRVIYQSECEQAIQLVASLAKNLYELDCELGVREQEHRSIPLSIVLVSGSKCRDMLIDTGILQLEAEGMSFDKRIPEKILANEAERACFLRGVFLGSGSCSSPDIGYHLEISSRTEDFANTVADIICSFGLSAKSSVRKGRHLVFISGDDVAGFLALIGATNASLHLEDVRAQKDYRNYLNRANNCETANIGKTVNAAYTQVHAIEILEQHINLKDLPAPLYEAAYLRMQHPEATLQELADLAEIGKSGMNHRMARILALAKEYETIS